MTARELLSEPYLQKSPDCDQFAVATCTENTIVAAGAGSGKTQTLATRFAYLVMSDARNTVEKILTLTFTEKAASEMYRRIYSTLKKFSETLPECEEKNRAKKAVQDFSKARIQTLDSFSMQIVKQAANLYGISPDFSVGAANTENVIEQLAFNFIMKSRNSAAIQWISEAGNFQGAANFFSEAAKTHATLSDSLLEKCRVFEKSFFAQKKEISKITSQENFIEKIFLGISDLCAALFECKSKAKEISNLKIAAEEFQKSSEMQKIKSQKIPDIAADEKSAIEWAQKNSTQTFLRFLNQFNAKIKLQKNNEEVCECIEKLFESGKEGTQFLAAADFILNYENLKELYSLLDQFCEEVNSYKRQSGSLTFSDSAKMALRILFDQGQIRKELRENFSKIMIDEFQDNNGANRDLLLLLSRKNEAGERLAPCDEKDILEITGPILPNRLFFVGDEKQSIYKFRGADVAVFNELKEKIAGKILRMSNNYRTCETLLCECNAFFGAAGLPPPCKNFSVFPNERKPQQKNFEAVFDESSCAKFPKAKMEALKKNPPQSENENPTLNVANPANSCENPTLEGGKSFEEKNSKHKMHVCMLDTSAVKKNEKADFLSAKESRIFFIAKKILELNAKKNSFKDFAILCKSRADYAQIARIFSLTNIPYSLDQEANIFAEAPVNDIYNVLRLCVYPADMTSYCAFLHSPFCGLALSEAEDVLALSENKIAFDDEAEEKIAAQLEGGGYEKYFRAKNFFQKIQNEFLSEPLCKSITKLWYECGYRYALLWTKVCEAENEISFRKTENFMEEQYDLLFELAREADAQCKDASWFVDQLAVLKNASRFSEGGEIDAKEVDYQSEKKDAVNVMTIHKSKGLEFPFVFVCGCADTKAESGHRFEKKIFPSENFGPIVIYDSAEKNYFAASAIAAEKEKNAAEFRRLVYVAITRAEKEVFIIGEWSRTSVQKNGAENYLLLNIINFYLEEGKKFSPFDFEEILQISKNEFDLEINKNPVSTERYNKILFETAAFYNSISEKNLIETPCVRPLRATPSLLEESDFFSGTILQEKTERPLAALPNEDLHDAALSNAIEKKESPASKTYSQINTFVNSAALKKNEYGTLFHSFMETWAKNWQNFSQEKIDAENFFDESLVQKISLSHKKILLETFFKILKTFLEPKSGEQNAALLALQKGREFFCEYKFKTKIHSYILTGSIDAVFQNADGTYTVLDYKTDCEPNAKNYFNQLGCYQKVAADLFAEGDVTKIRCILFFCETGEFFDITKEAKESYENLSDEKIAKLILKVSEENL